MMKKIYLGSFFLVNTITGLSGMHLTRPYERMLLAERRDPFFLQASMFVEHGYGTTGYDDDGHSVNALRIWNNDQNALKMLEGFDPASEIGQLRIQIGANDDGTRGHFTLRGDLDYRFGIGLGAVASLPCDFSLSAYLSFYQLKLHNVLWENKTLNITADDARVRAYLTDDFFAHVRTLGRLELDGWTRSGIGDLTCMAEWRRNFEQKKDFLQNVQLGARIAAIFPTGKKSDEDKIFALAFGNDGAFGGLIGADLLLTVANYLRLGVDVELTHLVSSTRERRIKTHINQTEFLLLQKALALRDYGLTQRFNLSAELHRFFGGLSVKAGYQFLRHGDDTYTVCDNKFSSNVASSAASLQEWTLHNLFLIVSYDGSHDECARTHHYVSAFIKMPFNGQYAVGFKTIGMVFALDF